MLVGLYDIDLLHSQKSVPNLELMKVYTYYHQNGDKVILMGKQEEEGRFNKIIYFKDNKNLKLPRKVDVFSSKKKIYGEGFFNKFTPLPDQFISSPPDRYCYSPYSSKFKQIQWNKFLNSSIIRFENQDYTGLIPDAAATYVVDRNFTKLNGAVDFLLDNKQQTFYFFHTLEINSEEEFEKFSRFTLILTKPLYINFKFNKDFLISNINEKLHYNLYELINETSLDHTLRLIKTGLVTKNLNSSLFGNKNFNKTGKLDTFILQWLYSRQTVSFEEFFKDNREAIALMLNAPAVIRLLLRTNPKTISTQTFDF